MPRRVLGNTCAATGLGSNQLATAACRAAGIQEDPAVAISILVISAYPDQAARLKEECTLTMFARFPFESRLAFIYLESKRVLWLAIGGVYYRRGTGVT